MVTQNDEILAHLQMKGSITPIEALEMYGCFRLSARIYELRSRGYEIHETTVRKTNVHGRKKQFAMYYMSSDSQTVAHERT